MLLISLWLGHDGMRQSVFIKKSLAIALVKDSFELYVSS